MTEIGAWEEEHSYHLIGICPLPNNMALVTASTWQMDVPETLEAVDGFVGSLSITLSAGGLGDDCAIINEGGNTYLSGGG